MSETNQPRKPVRGFAALPEARRREIYQLVNDSHDAGADCMKTYIRTTIASMIGMLQTGGLAHQINPEKTSGGRFILETFLKTLDHPGVGMHPHEPFEVFDRSFSKWVADQPENGQPENGQPAKSFVTRPVRE